VASGIQQSAASPLSGPELVNLPATERAPSRTEPAAWRSFPGRPSDRQLGFDDAAALRQTGRAAGGVSRHEAVLGVTPAGGQFWREQDTWVIGAAPAIPFSLCPMPWSPSAAARSAPSRIRSLRSRPSRRSGEERRINPYVRIGARLALRAGACGESSADDARILVGCAMSPRWCSTTPRLTGRRRSVEVSAAPLEALAALRRVQQPQPFALATFDPSLSAIRSVRTRKPIWSDRGERATSPGSARRG